MRATLVEMERGESLLISLDERAYTSIRSCAASLPNAYPGRKYKVNLVRDARACKVTRLA